MKNGMLMIKLFSTKKKYDMKEVLQEMEFKNKEGARDLKEVSTPTTEKLQNNATSVVQIEDDVPLKSFVFLQSRVYLLSSIIGDRHHADNRVKGSVGLALWVLNMCIHFSFDFYEAKTVFHFSWASSIGVFFVMFIVCTVFLIRHTVKWFVRVIKKLSRDKTYVETIKWLCFFFKFSPHSMLVLSVSGAAAQYGCYAYDDALTLKFNSGDGNITSENIIPLPVEVILNVVRFTSLMHIYYMMFLLLVFAALIFFTIVHSQRAFNVYIGKELKAHPPSMSFQEAVDKFAVRTKLLRGASENTTVIFTTLLIATSLSFVVNAYNFLFIKRYAIYIWFAIAPLLWTVSILLGAALVTSSFQKLKIIVIQSWVEIPEKYDELWSRSHTQLKAQPSKSISMNWRAGLENMRRRREEREELNKTQTENQILTQNNKQDTLQVNDKIHFFQREKEQSFVENVSVSNVDIPEVIVHKIQNNNNNDDDDASYNKNYLNYQNPEGISRLQNHDNHDKYLDNWKKTIPSSTKSVEIPNEEVKNTTYPGTNEIFRLKDLASSKGRNSMKSAERSKTFERRLLKNIGKNKCNNNSMGNIVRVAQTVQKFKNISRRKFNYEKYIKFLELTLDTIGFSLGKMTITWDRVSFFIVLLLTLVGVFAQNAFLKDV